MENLIERYIAAVVGQLPEKERVEVEKELRSNIYDMLSDDPSEAEIERVLRAMGSPKQLAEQYRQNPRYLISPQAYDEYIRLLKYLVPIIGVITAIVGIFSGFVEASSQQVNEILQAMFQSGVQSGVSGVMQTLVWTTVGFVIAERTGVFTSKQEEWSLADLPSLTAEKIIPVSDVVGEIIAVLFFGAFLIFGSLNFLPSVISKSWDKVVPLFDEKFIVVLLPVVIIGLVLTLIASVMKLIDRRWTNRVCFWSIIDTVVSAIMWVFLIMRNNIFSQELIDLLQKNDWSDGDILHYIATGNLEIPRLLISTLIVVVSLIQVLLVIYYRSKRNSPQRVAD